MSEQDLAGPAANGTGSSDQPTVGLVSQYVKDLSFENPGAPAIFQLQGQPQIDVQFNIGAAQVGDEVHELVLKIDVKATVEGQVAYVVDLAYAGLFAVQNVPMEHLQPFMLGEAPRLIFPFARRVIADAVRDGGYPPLMLDPIDFASLYMQQIQAQGENGQPIGNA